MVCTGGTSSACRRPSWPKRAVGTQSARGKSSVSAIPDAHGHAALHLSLEGLGIHHEARVVRRHDALEPVVGTEDRELAGVAVGHVQDRVGPRPFPRGPSPPRTRPRTSCPPGPRTGSRRRPRAGDRSAVPARSCRSAAAAATHARRHASPVMRVWREAVVVPESGVVAVSGCATLTRSGIEAEDVAGDLREDRREALSDAGGARADLHAVRPSTFTTHLPMSAVPHAEAGVLERAGHARPVPARGIEVLLHGEQAFLEGGVRSRHLPVGERVAGPHRVAQPDLPR